MQTSLSVSTGSRRLFAGRAAAAACAIFALDAAQANGPSPIQGAFATAYSESRALDGCLAASTLMPDAVATCTQPVYISDQRFLGTFTPGQWVTAGSRQPLGSNVAIPFEPAVNRPWWWGPNDLQVQGAAARANADPTRLRAGAFAVDEYDKVWFWNPNGPGSPYSEVGGPFRGVQEFARASAQAEARTVDTLTVQGSGQLSFTFRIEGLYEAGNNGAIQGRGAFAFALGLYDLSKTVLQGDSFVFVDPSSYSLAGLHFNYTGADPLRYSDMFQQPGLENFVVPGFAGPAGNNTPFDSLFTVTMDVTDGQQIILAATLRTRANGFTRCDDNPGNGIGCIAGGSLDDNITLVDFSNSAVLTQVVLGGGVTGITSFVGANYMALVVPEPGTWALWLLGGAALVGVARRNSRRARQAL